jgi:hypothetical protein
MLGGVTAQRAHQGGDSNHGDYQRCQRLGAHQVDSCQGCGQISLHVLDNPFRRRGG